MFEYFFIYQVIGGACAKAAEVLYVHFDPASTSLSAVTPPLPLSIKEASNIVQKVYSHSFSVAPALDVRVILTGFKGHSTIPTATKYPVKQVMVDFCPPARLHYFVQRYRSYLNNSNPAVLIDALDPEETISSNESSGDGKVYKSIVGGGTFDCIHNGHKVLVTEGLLRCSDVFTIGMADGPLTSKKTLNELIAPVDTRIKNLRDLLIDIDSSVEYRLEPIYEPLGPSGVDPDMEMIIVSQETLKGGNYVNKARSEKGLCTLDVSVIDLIEDPMRNPAEEVKISSSSMRMRKLGNLLRERKSKDKMNSLYPFVIGLTGGSASGKTNLAKKLSEFGAGVIDCDILGHEAYLRGTDCYQRLVKAFGPSIISDDGQVNRKALGALVFGDSEKLKLLNSLVWPEIGKMVLQKLADLHSKGIKVAVLDAAVLLEAGWNTWCDEVINCPSSSLRDLLSLFLILKFFQIKFS